MKLLVVSYKTCWPHADSPSGYATDGGFPFQMRALSELFDATTLLLPCLPANKRAGESWLSGHHLAVQPIPPLAGADFRRKLRFPFWLLRNLSAIWRAVRQADAVHAPIPGDIGTVGMLFALLMRKPLFVRHCGNWTRPVTLAEHFWKWLMIRYGGNRNVFLATGGAIEPPAPDNPAVRWIFSTTLTQAELQHCAIERGPAPRHPPRLLLAARQIKEKGVGLVIASLPLLLAQWPGLQFDVVGDGPDLAAFKQQAAALGVSANVVFHGRVNHEQVIALMQAADVFCFPSTASEGFPKAVLEALACGLPAITTRVSVLPFLIGQGGGLLLDQASARAIADAVRACLADPARYRAMSAQAVATAQSYSLETWRDTIGGWLRTAWGPLRAEHEST